MGGFNKYLPPESGPQNLTSPVATPHHAQRGCVTTSREREREWCVYVCVGERERESVYSMSQPSATETDLLPCRWGNTKQSRVPSYSQPASRWFCSLLLTRVLPTAQCSLSRQTASMTFLPAFLPFQAANVCGRLGACVYSHPSSFVTYSSYPPASPVF